MSEELSETLHQNDLGEIQECGCGGLVLVMGPLSLHFTPDEAELLHDLVTVGIHTIGRQTPESHSPEHRSRRGKPAGPYH